MMHDPDDPDALTLRPRPSEAVTLNIPTDTLAQIERVAAARDMSVQALLKLYIGQSLREDVAKLFADRVLATAADVLAQLLVSDAEAAEIMDQIRRELRSSLSPHDPSLRCSIRSTSRRSVVRGHCTCCAIIAPS